jgi:hypothetical protein
MTSFGHRPSSASRTFHPATMKVRLRHGEIAKSDKKAVTTGFGLPVAILSKLLHAPKLPPVEGAGDSDALASGSLTAPFDRNDLFSMPRTNDMSALDSSIGGRDVGTGTMGTSASLTRPSWVSQQSTKQSTGSNSARIVLGPVRTNKRRAARGKVRAKAARCSHDIHCTRLWHCEILYWHCFNSFIHGIWSITIMNDT